ncbi:uncharacterized protein LOC106161794 [Lingula anatina]|uniref:Uncharacterized protein LOC106161794 n=1 Tax=Lingula anatina TaxID=7574 RepID=A0A1S3I8T1_LINAN|nr:uncharacterized protein LOC106161794 [Lingula anatina]|eukprot:XP_013394276.1 uncharacterized protein LOC106161794 [Lingula anatina]
MESVVRVFFVASFLGIVAMVNAGRGPIHNDRRDTCSNSATPCYDYVLTYIIDGRTENLFRQSRSEILAIHRLAGKSEADAIQEGKMVTAWLKRLFCLNVVTFFPTKYGIDFTDVEDNVYIDGTKAVTSPDGFLTFRTFIADPAARARLVSASKQHEVEFFNAPISNVGWIVMVNNDYQGSGTFNMVLPKGSTIFYGDYIIPLCDSTGKKSKTRLSKNNFYYGSPPCRNIFNQSTLKIHYESNTYFSSVGVIDCVVKETSWGTGVARGVLFIEADNKVSGRNVLTFPASQP